MSCYGVSNNPTPSIDKLAADGVLFERVFMPAPVCSATRSALMTGAMQTTFGVHNPRAARAESSPVHLPKGVKTLPELFKDAGYFTFNVGKDDYNFTYDRENLYSGPYKKDYKQGHKGAPIDWNSRKEGQPFFGQIQLDGGKSKAKIDGIDPASVEMPPYYPDHPVLRKDWAHHFDTTRIMDREVGEIIERLKNDPHQTVAPSAAEPHPWQGKTIHPVKITVIKATYGAEDSTIDVTEILSKHYVGKVSGGIARIVNYKNEFGDPAPGKKKKLTVTYKLHNKQYTRSFAENNTIQLSR